MTKTNIITSVLVLGAFFIGYLIPNKPNVLSEKLTSDSEKISDSDVSPTEQFNESGKEWNEGYKLAKSDYSGENSFANAILGLTNSDNDQFSSHVGEIYNYPEKKIMILSRPTSLESGVYDIIDYSGIKYYVDPFKHPAYFSTRNVTTPKAFINNTTILAVQWDRRDLVTTDLDPTVIVATDLNGTVVKKLLTLSQKDDVLSVSGNGENLEIKVGDRETNKESRVYKINPQSLTLY